MKNLEQGQRDILVNLPFEQSVAELIGGNINPQRVVEVIRLSREGQHFFHGVKKMSSVEAVRENGIMPLTPEGGFVSFWATGASLFGDANSQSLSFSMFDSPFFNYAHTGNAGKSGDRMTLAVTNRSLLNQDIPSFENERYSITLHKPVSRREFLLLRVLGGDIGQRYRAMFDLIETSLKDGYVGGQEKEVVII